MIRKLRPGLTAVLALALAILSQGCQKSTYYSQTGQGGKHLASSIGASANGGGDGIPVEGRVIRYLNFDVANPCSELGSDGKPLANSEIDMDNTSTPQSALLVRDQCSIVSPAQDLSLSNITFATDGSGDLSYKNVVYAPAPPAAPTPRLSYDFTISTALPTSLTWSRPSSATYYDSSGLLVTAPAGTPRFDFDPVTHQLKGLLMEPAGTNSLAYSEAFDQAGWQKTNVTATANTSATTAPDGSTHADLVRETASGVTFHGTQEQGVSYVPGSIATFSMFVKAAGRSQVTIGIQDDVVWSNSICIEFDLPTASILGTCNSGDGSGTRGTITPLPNGWFRLTVTGIPTSSYNMIQAGVDMMSGGNAQYAGDGTSGIYAWGAQLELNQSSASSYIATGASTASRAADSAQFNTMSWYNSAAGTLLADFLDLGSEASGPYGVFGLYQSNGGSFLQNSLALSDQGATNASSVESGGSMVFSPGGALNGPGSVNKLAMAYASGDFAYSANGGAAVTSSGGAVPAAAAYAFIGSQPDGKVRRRIIRRIEYYDARLTDAQVQQLSQ